MDEQLNNPLSHWGGVGLRNPHTIKEPAYTKRQLQYKDNMDKQRFEQILFSGDNSARSASLNQRKERMLKKLQKKKQAKKNQKKIQHGKKNKKEEKKNNDMIDEHFSNYKNIETPAAFIRSLKAFDVLLTNTLPVDGAKTMPQRDVIDDIFDENKLNAKAMPQIDYNDDVIDEYKSKLEKHNKSGIPITFIRDKKELKQLLQSNKKALETEEHVANGNDAHSSKSKDLIQEKAELQRKHNILLSQKQTEINDLRASNKRMQQRYNSLDQRYQQLSIKQESNQCANTKLIEQHKELERKYNELAAKYSEQQKKIGFESWSTKDAANWIVNIDKLRYDKYYNHLLENMMNEGIDGLCLPDLDKNDLHRLGITQFKDKRDIYKSIQKLVHAQRKEHDNNNNKNENQNEGESNT